MYQEYRFLANKEKVEQRYKKQLYQLSSQCIQVQYPLYVFTRRRVSLITICDKNPGPYVLHAGGSDWEYISYVRGQRTYSMPLEIVWHSTGVPFIVWTAR